MLSRSKLNPASSVDDRCGIGNGHSPFQKVLLPGQRNVWGSQQLQTGADGSAHTENPSETNEQEH